MPSEGEVLDDVLDDKTNSDNIYNELGGGELYDDIGDFRSRPLRTVTAPAPPVLPRTNDNTIVSKHESEEKVGKESFSCKKLRIGRLSGVITAVIVVIILIVAVVVIVLDSSGIINIINKTRTSNKKLRVKFSSNKYGTMTITLNGQEGKVCDKGWDDNSCRVACRDIDLSHGIAAFGIDPKANKKIKRKIYSGKFRCKGNEYSLVQCLSKGQVIEEIDDCPINQTASCICHYKQIKPEVRLSFGSQGRVELSILNIIGTVCGKGWTDTECKVTCRQSGFGRNGLAVSTQFGNSKKKIWAESFTCSGSEKSLDNCEHSTWGIHGCDQQQYASCACSKTATNKVTVDLMQQYHYSSSKVSHGFVYISINDFRGKISGLSWTSKNCMVVCKSVGYSFGMARAGNERIGHSVGNRIAGGFKCVGNEQSLDRCDHMPWTEKGPDYNFDAYCYCYEKPIVPKVTISEGFKGVVSMSYKGIPRGIICPEHWDDNDCKVACRQSGYSNAMAVDSELFQEANWGDSQGDPRNDFIFGHDFNCTGSEMTLDKCERSEWGNFMCYDSAACICDKKPLTQKCKESICSTYREWKECKVYCKQLGYESFTDKVKKYPDVELVIKIEPKKSRCKSFEYQCGCTISKRRKLAAQDLQEQKINTKQNCTGYKECLFPFQFEEVSQIFRDFGTNANMKVYLNTMWILFKIEHNKKIKTILFVYSMTGKLNHHRLFNGKVNMILPCKAGNITVYDDYWNLQLQNGSVHTFAKQKIADMTLYNGIVYMYDYISWKLYQYKESNMFNSVKIVKINYMDKRYKHVFSMKPIKIQVLNDTLYVTSSRAKRIFSIKLTSNNVLAGSGHQMKLARTLMLCSVDIKGYIFIAKGGYGHEGKDDLMIIKDSHVYYLDVPYIRYPIDVVVTPGNYLWILQREGTVLILYRKTSKVNQRYSLKGS